MPRHLALDDAGIVREIFEWDGQSDIGFITDRFDVMPYDGLAEIGKTLGQVIAEQEARANPPPPASGDGMTLVVGADEDGGGGGGG